MFADLTLFELRHAAVNLRVGASRVLRLATGSMRGVQMTVITHDTILIHSRMMIDPTELYRSVELIKAERKRERERGRERRRRRRENDIH